MNRLLALLSTAALLIITLSGCSSVKTDTGSTVKTTGTTVTAATVSDLNTDDLFSKRDSDSTYDATSAITVTLSGNSAKSSSSLVTVSGSTVTLKGEGTYLLTGSLTDGRIVVDAEKTAKLQLVLNGVSVNSSTGCALYVKQADKVFVTLADGTVNTLSNSGDFVQTDSNTVDAVFFSKEDLTINGTGTLTVNATYGHGIVSKDDLVITNGTATVKSASHGLAAKDCLKASGGDWTIISGTDGIHTENKDDATLGYLYISGGTWNITAGTDALDAATLLQIDGGTFTLKSGGGSANASNNSSGNWGRWGPGTNLRDSSSDTSSSAKGLKAGGKLIINQGSFVVDSSDDALHTNGDLAVTGGEITLSSGDDGLHADDSLTISGGTVVVSKSYEGIEAQTILVSGGTISVVASDDGFNAAGGSDSSSLGGRPGQNTFSGSSAASLTISGGTIHVNASGDGLDSNGTLTVTGGETYVSGPTDNGNGALDYGEGCEAVITGGIVVAAGSTGMAENFGEQSTQGSLLHDCGSQSAGSAVTLTDSSGKVLVSYTPEKSYQCVVISAPGLKQGGTYTIKTGSSSASVTLSSLIYSDVSGGMGGKPGGQPGGKGDMNGRPNGFNR